ncbi:hypothetical protein C8R45DRAFT_1098122 [Mycena sanguinolenta]|nr:hypothetical protein C8R45DRAFT_1098122 [Mycena sanguinolenta]
MAKTAKDPGDVVEAKVIARTLANSVMDRYAHCKELNLTNHGREAHLLLKAPTTPPSTSLTSIACFSSLAAAAPLLVWCWCPRSFGAINWFVLHPLQIATVGARPEAYIDIRIFVTCFCDPNAVPTIPGCAVTEARATAQR